jgi:hypothetical protein
MNLKNGSGDTLAKHRYLHFDVFTDHPFTGNQLAVFPNAAGLDSDVMQRTAAEIGFSETAFVLPAETTTTDVRLRIFTPAVELPMAGHPTIGTAFALAHEGLWTRHSHLRVGGRSHPGATGMAIESASVRLDDAASAGIWCQADRSQGSRGGIGNRRRRHSRVDAPCSGGFVGRASAICSARFA